MTLPGGGSANIGTVTGKVRINYESSNAAKATKDVLAFQDTLTGVGRVATRSAEEVDRAGNTLGAFGRTLQRFGQRPVANPAQGLGQRVENETTRATRAIANLNRTTQRGITLTSNIKLNANKVDVDTKTLNNSLTNAVQATRLQPVTVRVPVKVDPSDVTVNQGAISRAVGKVTSSGSGAGAGSAGGGASGLAAVAPMLGRITVAAGAAGAAVGGVAYVLGKGFGRLTNIDNATVKLAALGKNAKEIAQISKSSLDAVQGTAFGLEEAFSTAADAINAGIKPGKDLDKYLQATANTAALAQVGMQDLGSAFSQAAVQGKLTGDIMQLLYSRQVPVLKLLADEYGVTQTKAQEMVSNGEVSFDRFINAMSKTGGAAKAMGNTIGGSFNNLKAAVSRLGANLLAPIFGKENASDANLIATAIQKITTGVDWLGKTVKAHTGGIVTFWEALAKGGISVGKVFVGLVGFITDAMVKITEVVGDTTGWLSRAVAGVAKFVGATGFAKDANEFADSMHNLGSGIREIRDNNMGKFNRSMDQAWNSVTKWADGARNAAKNTGDLGDNASGTAAKVISLKEALEGLKIKADAAETALTGTNAQFKAFLKEVKEKGGTDALLKTLTDVRTQFENGGRQVKNFADAMENFKDSTLDASSRADALVSSLQKLGLLPGGDALSSYNEQFDKMTDYMSNIIDLTDTTGDKLANLDGTLNLNFKNSRELQKQIESIRTQMLALVASGEATPDEAYARTVQGLNDLLQRQAGLSPELAKSVIDKYLPKDTLLEAIKAQNPQEALQQLFKDNPAQLDSVLNLLTTTQDILNKIVGPDGQLHVPTVLDTPGTNGVQGPPSPPVGPVAPPANTGNGPTITALPGEDPTKPLSPERRKQLGIPDSVGPIYPSSRPGAGTPNPTGRTVPANPGVTPKLPANTSAPEDLGGLLGNVPDPTFSQDQLAKIAALSQNQQAFAKALGDNPEIKKSLQGLIDQANAQGENLSAALAEGMLSGSDEVKKALLELAGMAGDYLGHSPAKYGPLSGKGWTLYRGKVFTQDWAKGISSEASAAASAGENVAGAATGGLRAGGAMPLNDQITQMIKDLQEFSDFGKKLLDFGKQISDIAFGVAKFANDLSGGALFPKTYTKDPTALGKRGSAVGPWNPTASPVFNPGGSGGAGGAAPGALGANASKQDIANYIINKAKSLGYSEEQAKYFATQAFGESGFRPDANGGNQDGTGNVGGIFQFTPGTWGNRPGSMWNAQDNIDQYFALAAERGLTPQNFTDPTQLGTQVSKGGPYHPSNVGHRQLAEQGVQPYLAGYSGPPTATTPQPVTGPNGKPLFTSEGPQFYDQAFAHNKEFAVPSDSNYQTALSAEQEKAFRKWVADNQVPFDPAASVVDYDMRGFWQAMNSGQAEKWTKGSHFPDTFKTPYDTTFSAESKYATKNNPFKWQGDNLVDTRNGNIVFGAAQGTTPAAKPTLPPGNAKDMVDVITPGGPIKARRDIAEKMLANGAWTLPEAQADTTAATPSGAALGPYGLKPGTDIRQGAAGFPPWVYALAQTFGTTASTYAGHQEKGPHGENQGIDWWPAGVTPQMYPGKTGYSADQAASLDRFAEWLGTQPGVEQVIWQNPITGNKTGFAGGKRVGPGTDQPGYYADDWSGHTGHVHTRFSQGVGAPGSLPPALGGQTGQQGVPVTITGQASQALQGIWNNTGTLPTMTSSMQELVNGDPILQQAIANRTSLTEDSVVPVLQHIDTAIAQQNKLGTPESKILSDQLTTMKNSFQSQFGLKEGPSMLDQAQGIANGVSSIASDIFGLFDQGLKTISATQDLGNTLVRGIENTKDVNRVIDDAQEFITLFQKGFQTASDITGFAASIASAAGSGDPTGIGGGAAGGLQAASALTGLIAQGLAAVNTAIDLGQEAYKITTKYVGRFIQSWVGLSGASDVKYLLDTVTGQVQAYSSDNPQNKTTFNTLGRELGKQYPDRQAPINQFTIYQGPGQDPRDTMDDAMFTIRSSGQGAFGYAV